MAFIPKEYSNSILAFYMISTIFAASSEDFSLFLCNIKAPYNILIGFITACAAVS